MNFNQRTIYYVKKIPFGNVATYGQIAALAGSPRASRAVGWVLHALPEKELRITPWHRVINREGRVSTTCREHSGILQAALLKKERISVHYKDGNYFVSLKEYLWQA